MRFRSILLHPTATSDLVPVVLELELAAPRRGMVEIVGAECGALNDVIAVLQPAAGHSREVTRDPEAR